MLLTSKSKYEFAFDAVGEEGVICCNKRMHPRTTPFGVDCPNLQLLTLVCPECDAEVEDLYDHIPSIKVMMDVSMTNLKKGIW